MQKDKNKMDLIIGSVICKVLKRDKDVLEGKEIILFFDVPDIENCDDIDSIFKEYYDDNHVLVIVFFDKLVSAWNAIVSNNIRGRGFISDDIVDEIYKQLNAFASYIYNPEYQYTQFIITF